jgi:hypothetical protein
MGVACRCTGFHSTKPWFKSLISLQKSDAPKESQKPVKLSQRERKAKHAEFNRQLWESAYVKSTRIKLQAILTVVLSENPEPLLFLQARDNTPIPSTFKPNVTLLSRKPQPQLLTRNGATVGMAGLKLEDDDDSEEERRKKAEESFAERKARAEVERAEKQRKYAEAREKLFGSPAPSSGESRGASPNKQSRGKGRGRGGRDSQPRSSNEQSPARPPPGARQLYDPSYSLKPDSVYIQKRDSKDSRPGTPNGLQQPIREPRGPQAIGRGGHGFAPRGNHAGSST